MIRANGARVLGVGCEGDLAPGLKKAFWQIGRIRKNPGKIKFCLKQDFNRKVGWGYIRRERKI
jgi:hypothetical protein